MEIRSWSEIRADLMKDSGLRREYDALQAEYEQARREISGQQTTEERPPGCDHRSF